jgi:antirestriction protein ArdC
MRAGTRMPWLEPWEPAKLKGDVYSRFPIVYASTSYHSLKISIKWVGLGLCTWFVTPFFNGNKA